MLLPLPQLPYVSGVCRPRCFSCLSTRHSLVTAITSSSVVTPGAHLDQARLAQVTHAFLAGLRGDVQCRALGQDDALDFFGDWHHLVDADSALVAVVAGRTAHRTVGLPGAVEIFGREARA